MSETVKWIVFLLLPYAISWIQRYFGGSSPGGGQKVIRSRIRTQFDWVCLGLSLFLTVSSAAGVWASYSDSSNILVNLSLKPDSSLSTVKHRFNALKKSMILVYSQVGHSAFVECTWCQPETAIDYFIFSLPFILLEYISVAIIVGIISSVERRARWRLWGAVLLGVGGAAEVLCLISPLTFLDEEVNPVQTSLVRRLVFAALGVLMAWFDGSGEVTEDDKMVQMIEKQKHIFSRLQGSRLAHSAVFGTKELRQQYMKYHETAESDLDALSRDGDYKRERMAILQTQSVGLMLQTSQMISGSIMQAAVSDGFLTGGIDVLPPTTVDDL
ncbi:hypothetical protein BDR26DRAFT_874780 [Obelidium mucronatum]|nr:hypothetical protein BDR26DRAFT_874780 [Obelidium mucronatum]